MDPLSITTAVVGFIGTVGSTIAYIETVRHAKDDARTSLAGFKRILSELESFKSLLKHIEAQVAAVSTTSNPFTVDEKPRKQYARAQNMNGETETLERMINILCTKVNPEGQSRFRSAKTALFWKLERDRIKDGQAEVMKHMASMRKKLDDDQVEVQLESWQILRELKLDKDIHNNIAILDWICSDGLDDPLHPASQLALENSSFVQSDEMYAQWYGDKAWQMNCFGRPGCGKNSAQLTRQSVRSQAVLADLRDRFDQDQTPVLSLFFNYKRAARQSVESVMRSLLRQLILSRRPVQIPKIVLDYYNEVRLDRDSLDEDKARLFLQEELAARTNAFLVIDALDEAGVSREEIHDEIRWLRASGVCIFSTEFNEQRSVNAYAYCYRHQMTPGDWEPLALYWRCTDCDGPLGQGIEICRDCYHKGLRCDNRGHIMAPPERVHVEVRASTQDMERFAKRFLEDGATSGDVGNDSDMFSGYPSTLAMLRDDVGPDVWTRLPARIAEAAEGNFLHAQLFLERLKEQNNPYEANALLEQLQNGSMPDIDEHYHEKLERCLQGSGAKIARNYFTLVAAAVEVLQYDQLQHAVAVEADDHTLSDFIGRCTRKEIVRRHTAGLLLIDSAKQKDTFLVGFAHRTFSVYINTHPSETFPDANQRMLDACLSYLSLDPFAKPFKSSTELEAALAKYPFASYAACYWGTHAQNAKQTAGNGLRILQLLNDSARFNCVLQIAWRTPSMLASSWDVRSGLTPLHACAFYGLDALCAALASVLPNVDTADETYGQTPLLYACRHDHLEIARSLLRVGASPNHVSKLGRLPLLEAIEYDRQDIFDLLLTHEFIDVNLKGSGKGDRPPLVRAAELGRQDMVRSLLACKKIAVNDVDGYNCTALSRAVQRLQIACVRQLLNDKDTDLSIRDSTDSRTALDWLAHDSLNYDDNLAEILEIAEMLMDDPRTPLPSDSAILAAIALGKNELLRQYVKRGLHNLYKDQYGRNYLHLAATEGACAIVTLFYDRLSSEASFNIDSLDMYKATALHAACNKLSDTSHVDTIKFLLDVGANPNLEDDEGFTPPKLARRASSDLWNSHVRALFATSAIAGAGDGADSSPVTLAQALNTAKLDAFKAALDRLPDPLSPGIARYSSSTILHQLLKASEDFCQEALPLILPRTKIFLSAVDANGQTCAHLAVKENSIRSLTVLCEAGINLDIRDRWNMTAFELAQSWQRYDLCVYLASRGAELPSSDRLRPEVLCGAVDRGDLTAVERLVQAGVDVNFRDIAKGQTNVQRAEELKEDAAKIAGDKLKLANDPRTMSSMETWLKHKYGAPEVVKRDVVLQYLQKAQEKQSGPRETNVDREKAMAKLIAKLNKMSPETLLTASSLSERPSGSTEQQRPIRSNTTFGGPRRAMSGLPPVPAAVATSLKFEVDTNVVIIAVAVIFGVVVVAIALILSSSSRSKYVPQLHPIVGDS